MPDEGSVKEVKRMDALEWLARWEQIEAPGRHTRIYPAQFAHGYQFDAHSFRQRGVSRAIPVSGQAEAIWFETGRKRRYGIKHIFKKRRVIG